MNKIKFCRENLAKDLDVIKRNDKIKEKFLLIANVSFFSRINYLYGFEYGNIFIEEIGAFLDELINKKAIEEDSEVETPEIEEEPKILYYLHGAEFAFIVKSREDLDFLTTEIKNRFLDSWKVQGLEQFYTVALGIAEIKKEDSSDKIIYKATMSGKQAKKKTSILDVGKGYDTKMDPFQADIQIEYQLRRAVMGNLDRFKVRYQPIVNVKTGKIYALEGLCTWFDDEIGFVMPNDFIGFAEYLGLIDIIDTHVFKTSVNFTKELHDLGHKFKISVNLSSKSLFNENLADSIREIVEAAELDFEYINLEITESEAISNLVHALNQINKIKAMGITVSLDDFGTGFSSLGRLRDIPVDSIKIDRSFIQGIHNSEYHSLFVKTIIDLGKCAGMRTVCEGIETTQDFMKIRAFGSDYAQGYLFSKPIYREQLLELLKKKPSFNISQF